MLEQCHIMFQHCHITLEQCHIMAPHCHIMFEHLLNYVPTLSQYGLTLSYYDQYCDIMFQHRAQPYRVLTVSTQPISMEHKTVPTNQALRAPP